MTATIAQTVGVDISKLTLDVYLHPQATARQFPNTAAGIKSLLTWLSETSIHRVVFEPTGAYHRGLERQLGDAGVPMVKVNPLQARRFAEAIGQRAKTDAVDAAMLARFGALDALQTRPIVSQTLSDMKELAVARRGLVKDRVAATNRKPCPPCALAQALGRSTVAPGRAPDRCHRRGVARLVPSGCRTEGAARHPRQHPGHRRGDCIDDADRDARARHDRQQMCRQSRRPRADRP